ncbi:uncharacterized protein [Haliotis cracherodii]|uniref:uncharacterized protein n=1 Tax=Haliotis cracherodii TaxID=6455 RepID=UPI0039EB3DDC
MNASSYVQVDRMIWFPLPVSPLTFPAPCPRPTSESLAIPAPFKNTFRTYSTVPSVSLIIAGQFTVDDIDFVEVDLADEEPAQPPHSFLKALLSRVANFFRRIKSVLKKKDL